MPISPDTKDWTWVLEKVCPECGFDVRAVPREEMGSLLRHNVSSWDLVLAHPNVKVRPDDSTWSAMEYACHLRDVFKLYYERLQMMLEQDDAQYPNWDQDSTAVEDRYSEQEPEQVGVELRDAALQLADAFDAIEGGRWERRGTRSDGAVFTTESLARYLIHDPVHHLYDVGKGFVYLASKNV